MQTNPKIKAAEIDALHDSLIAKMNQHMGTMKVKLQEQRNAEEQERLRQIQMKMEAERKAKEAEEQRIRDEEETRKKKVCEFKLFNLKKIINLFTLGRDGNAQKARRNRTLAT